MAKSKILIAVSSPWASEKLLAPVADLALRLEADALVVHVAQAREEDEHESDARARGEQTLDVLTTGLREVGVEAEGVLLFSNNVAPAIINTASARDCTLIVTGRSGQGRLKRLMGGDVPTQLTRQSEAPVLVCPADWTGTV